jgi:predicted Zn-dependent protease
LDLSSRFKDATEPYYLDTYAWVNVQLNNLDEAQPILERVVKLHPNVAAYNYHLGVLYNKKGNAVKAKVYLNKAKGIADEQGNKILSNKLNELLKSY